MHNRNTLKYHYKYAAALGGCLSLLLGFVSLVFSASTSQRTEGPCSPAVADVKGNVSMNIVCEGVDPAILNEVISLLNEILKDTKKLEQFRQELDKTRKRTDQIEARQASRRVTQDQARQLIALLRGKSSALVEVSATANNAEAMQYAMDLGRTLVAAGWDVDGVGSWEIMGEIPIGLSIWIRDIKSPPTGATLLLESLRKVGIDVTMIEKTGTKPNLIDLFVGHNPLN